MNNSVAFSLSTKLYNHYHSLILEHFHILQMTVFKDKDVKIPLYTLAITPTLFTATPNPRQLWINSVSPWFLCVWQNLRKLKFTIVTI